MTQRTLVLSCAAAALAMTLAGCAGDSTNDAGASSTASATVTVTASPEAETKQSGVLKLGETADVGFARITALDVRADVPIDQGINDQERWSAVLVRTCATADTVEGDPLVITWFPWTVSDRQDGVYQITGITGGVTYPVPTYPQDPGQRIVKGQCVKGWIPFNVAPGVKLASVSYTSDSAPRPVTWRF